MLIGYWNNVVTNINQCHISNILYLTDFFIGLFVLFLIIPELDFSDSNNGFHATLQRIHLIENMDF